MKRSISKCKEFFAKGVRFGTQDTLTMVGFADDKLESTQFVTIISRKPKPSESASYNVAIDSDDNGAQNAIESFDLQPNRFTAQFKEDCYQALGFSSVSISFELSAQEFAKLKAILAKII